MVLNKFENRRFKKKLIKQRSILEQKNIFKQIKKQRLQKIKKT